MASLDTITEEELTAMTKAQLQAYAEENGVQGVSSSRQTKAEMIQTIMGA